MKKWNAATWFVCFLTLLPITGCDSSPQQDPRPAPYRGDGTSSNADAVPHNDEPEVGVPLQNPSEIVLHPTADSATQALSWRTGRPARNGIIFVSGVDGGFIEPADNMYDRIAAEWLKKDVPSVFVRYRNPGVLGPSVEDAMAAANYLRKQGVTRMAIIGWSFGGAVITNSAIRIPEVTTVIGFAPQAAETEAVEQFTYQSLLLIHSKEDENVPYVSSEQILDDAPPQIHKELFTIKNANHILDGEGPKLEPVVFSWLSREL